jgi:metal-responsive CopG/Arc/MetJ family transcriptional regulator
MSPHPRKTPVPTRGGTYEVISVSLPRDLVRRAKEVIPRSRRSRVIAAILRAFLDSASKKQVAEAYAAYYTRRAHSDVKEERDLLKEWEIADEETWRILDREARRGRRPPR